MRIAVKILLILAMAFSCSESGAQVTDSVFVMYQKDSAVIPETDPTVAFFQNNERLTAAAVKKITVVTKSKKVTTLSSFLKGQSMMDYPDAVLADLDNDGKKEFLIYNFTGGAHCCDEIYIFRNIAPNRYQHVVKMFGGHTIITAENEFEFSFDESFGYFFTCYACGYEDTSDAALIPLRRISLKYNKGKFSVVPGDTELRSIINDNLGKLGELPFEKLEDDVEMDNGLRKEIAMNLAVFYYSFGRNLTTTRELFNKYYKYPDAKKVWTAFTKNLLYIKKDNDF